METSVILTSAIKKVDAATYEMIKEELNGNSQVEKH